MCKKKKKTETISHGHMAFIGTGLQSKPVAYSSKEKSLERWMAFKGLIGRIIDCSVEPQIITV